MSKNVTNFTFKFMIISTSRLSVIEFSTIVTSYLPWLAYVKVCIVGVTSGCKDACVVSEVSQVCDLTVLSMSSNIFSIS